MSCLWMQSIYSQIPILLPSGNGMNNKWRTKNAEISGVDRVYDFGACTVRQLLMGYDEYLVEHNDNGYYIEDGRNPCFQSERYLQYLQFKNIIYLPRFNDDGSMTRVIPRWNYVVINDQTKRPAIPDKLNASAATLRDYYVPYFLESGATPILLSTYGYFSNFTNMTGLGNISMFTFRVHQGYEYYAQVLEENLPSNQRPRIAPVGMAFLVLYEEYRSLWEKLFFIDGYHPSPHGTYLMGCVLYATIFERMPRKSYYGSSPSALFKRARRMQIGKAQQHVMPFPTKDEANYLYRLAQRVVIDGYRPKSWRKYLRNEENYG